MLILLPPSEGKQPGGSGAKVSLPALSWHAELGGTRRRIGNALVELCRGDPATARAVLGLSEALDADRAAGAVIRSSPTMPAGRRYSGVLYDALGYPTLPAAARRRADAQLVTFSGLWGALRPTDAIPAYRIGIGTRLPGEPGLPVVWKDAIGRALAAEIDAAGAIDLRSAGYHQMAALPRPVAARVVRADVRGSSFAGKQAKGALVRELLTAPVPGPGNGAADALVEAARRLGLGVGPVTATAVRIEVPTQWRAPGWTPAAARN